MKQSFAFQWHITDECDQRCKHCYIFSGDSCVQLSSMSWDEIVDTFHNCMDFCEVYDRSPHFYITGGDPILHPDFWKLTELLHRHNAPFTIMGNPFHLTQEICNRLAAAGCVKYQMSIDGLEKTHDWFRKPGSYAETLEKVPLINASGMRSVIMTTVSATNVEEVPGIIDAVVGAGVSVYAFARYCPTGGEVDTSLTPERYRELLVTCQEKFDAYRAAGCATYFNKKDHLWTLLDYEQGRWTPPANPTDAICGGCNCGNCHMTILPTGDVYACRRVSDSLVGNVHADRLADLWVTDLERYRDYAAFEKCSRCELLAWCRGCPAVVAGTSGSFYAADPQCWKEVE